MPNRLTLLYSKIYYKKENYLKVKTAVFKYITPPIVKVKYIGTSVCFYIPIFSHSYIPNFLLYAIYVTRLPLVLWFYWFYQSRLLRTDFNPIQVLFQYLYYPVYKVCNTYSLLHLFVFKELNLQIVNQRYTVSCINLITFFIPTASYQIFSIYTLYITSYIYFLKW